MPKLLTIMLFAIITLGLFSGCEPGGFLKPNVKRTVADKVERESEGQISIVSFETLKTDEVTLLGQELRNTQYRMTLEFNASGRIGILGFDRVIDFKLVRLKLARRGFNVSSMVEDMENPGIDVRTGDKVKIEGNVQFLKRNGKWDLAAVTGKLVN